MARTITLKFPGTCADCGTKLAAGELARWYGRGRVYGIGWPTTTAFTGTPAGVGPSGATASARMLPAAAAAVSIPWVDPHRLKTKNPSHPH